MMLRLLSVVARWARPFTSIVLSRRTPYIVVAVGLAYIGFGVLCLVNGVSVPESPMGTPILAMGIIVVVFSGFLWAFRELDAMRDDEFRMRRAAEAVVNELESRIVELNKERTEDVREAEEGCPKCLENYALGVQNALESARDLAKPPNERENSPRRSHLRSV